MSAYIVHPDTLDLIVSAANAWRVRFPDLRQAVRPPAVGTWPECSPETIGQCLLDENVYSLHYRYPSGRHEGPEQFTWRPVSLDCLAAAPLSPEAVVLKSIACLRYQSCEAPDYDASAAASMLIAIERAAIARITAEAPWGWVRDWSITRAAEAREAAALRRG